MYVVHVFIVLNWGQEPIRRDFDFCYELVIFQKAKKWVFARSRCVATSFVSIFPHFKSIEEHLDSVVNVAIVFNQVSRLISPQEEYVKRAR